jgi:hypothetical protein
VWYWQRIYLSSVLETVAVTQRMEWSNEIDGALRVYTITITIAQPEAYRKLYSGTDANIKAALDGPFLAKLNAAIAKELKRKVTGTRRPLNRRPAHYLRPHAARVNILSRCIILLSSAVSSAVSSAGVVRRAGEKAQRSSSTAEHPAAEANGSSRRKKSAEDSDSDDDMEAAKEDAKTARHTRGEKDSHYGCAASPLHWPAGTPPPPPGLSLCLLVRGRRSCPLLLDCPGHSPRSSPAHRPLITPEPPPRRPTPAQGGRGADGGGPGAAG